MLHLKPENPEQPYTYENGGIFFMNLRVQALWSTLYLGSRQLKKLKKYTTMARSQKIDLAPFE